MKVYYHNDNVRFLFDDYILIEISTNCRKGYQFSGYYFLRIWNGWSETKKEYFYTMARTFGVKYTNNKEQYFLDIGNATPYLITDHTICQYLEKVTTFLKNNNFLDSVESLMFKIGYHLDKEGKLS